MKNKKTSSKKSQENGFLTKIKQLHTCIEKDHSELAKLYKKAVSEVEKKSSMIKKSLIKAKKSVMAASKDKKKSPQNHRVMTSLFLSLKKGEDLIKVEMEALKTGYKKFVAQEKSRKQVDKTLAKKAKNRKRIKRIRRPAEGIDTQALNTNDKLYKITE